MLDKPQIASDPLNRDPIPISRSSWLIIVIAGAASFAYHFNFGGINHAHLLPLVNYYHDATTYQHDYIYPAYTHFLSYFWYVVAFLAQYVSLKGLLLTVDALWCVFTAWAVFGLAYRLFASTTAARLAVLMLVLSKPSPAGIFISLHGSVDPFSHTNFVLPFLLLAWRWALENRWLPAWGLIGLLANIHVVSAAFFFCILTVSMLVHRPRQWWLFLAGPAAMFALASPMIFRIFTAVGPDQITTPDQIERLRFIYRMRMPYHRFPSTWAPRDWMSGLTWVILGAVSFLNRKRGPRDRMMLAAFAVLCAIVGWLYLVVEVRPFNVAMMAFPFGRAGRFAVLIALFYVAAWAAELLESSESGRRLAGLCLAAWGIATYYHIPTIGLLPKVVQAFLPDAYYYIPTAAMLPLLGLTRDVSRSNASRIGFATLMLVAAALLAWSGRRIHGYNIVVMMVFVALMIFIGQTRGWTGSIRWLTIGLTILPVAAALALRGQILGFVMLKGSTFSEALAVSYSMPGPHWIEMQRWVDRNLPQDAVLLTPFRLQGFRIYSRRAVVCEWKDPGIITCSHLPTLFEWEDRIRAYTKVAGSTEKDLQTIQHRMPMYTFLPQTSLVALAKTFDAGYIVIESFGKPLALPLLHENKQFRLYRVTNQPASPSAQPTPPRPVLRPAYPQAIDR